MRTPQLLLAYAPRGAGLRCAVAYLSGKHDVYGWFTGPCLDASIASCYFLLEDFYANRETGYDAVGEQDLHSDWSLDEARRHELARMQDAFAHEWLFYRGGPGAATGLRAYARAELACGLVNVRFERLRKFSTLQPNWTYYSPGFERPVLRHLARHWPLEYRHDMERVAALSTPGSGRPARRATARARRASAPARSPGRRA